jgi:DNA-binding transcriptional LysR family regulator
MDELRAITVFVRAADAATFNQAAVDLAISPQAVSKTIRQLEQQLGVRLFHRTTRQNSLTAEGRGFLESVRPGLDVIAGAIGRARAATEAIEGPLRITAASSARKVLTPLMAEFNAQHPRVQFDVLMDDSFTDIVAQKIDVGFRSGLEPTGHLIARRLFSVQQILCASPAYIAQHGAPKSLADLGLHQCTGFRHTETGRLLPWELMVDGELRQFHIQPGFCTNDPEAELDAVAAGLGLGLIDSINAAAEIRAGRLVPLLPAHRSENLGFYIYYAQRSNMPRRVRAFIDFMVQRLQGSKAFWLSTDELERGAMLARVRVKERIRRAL